METAASTSSDQRSGPLSGLRAVLMGGIGPAPYCAMLLADLGADVVRVDRPSKKPRTDVPFPMPVDPLSRGQRSVTLNLKQAEDVELAWRLIENADVLVEGFRPGAMERLGFGPEACQARNARLVYGRVTGWGQSGPLAQAPGHDINYIALTGVLDLIGRPDGDPAIPLNLVGDFAGGGLYLAFGILAAVFERNRSGLGQVVDAAMIDGTLSLMNMAYGLKHFGLMSGGRGENLLDGGAHMYDTYPCADGQRIAIGAIEPEFYRALCEQTGLDDSQPGLRFDPTRWGILKERIGHIIKTRTRDEWCGAAGAAAACLSPVLSVDEAPWHPHHKARGSFVEVEGVTLPAPGPRFSRTPAQTPSRFAQPGAHTEEVRDEIRNTLAFPFK